MSKLNRKLIPVCANCNVKIHTGNYDGMSLKDLHSNKTKKNPHLKNKFITLVERLCSESCTTVRWEAVLAW